MGEVRTKRGPAATEKYFQLGKTRSRGPNPPHSSNSLLELLPVHLGCHLPIAKLRGMLGVIDNIAVSTPTGMIRETKRERHQPLKK